MGMEVRIAGNPEEKMLQDSNSVSEHSDRNAAEIQRLRRLCVRDINKSFDEYPGRVVVVNG